MSYGFIRPGSPDSVMKTLKTALIAHNLIRVTGNAAASRHRVDRELFSFKGATTSFRLFFEHSLVGGASPGIANFRRLLWLSRQIWWTRDPEGASPGVVKKKGEALSTADMRPARVSGNPAQISLDRSSSDEPRSPPCSSF